MSRPPPEDDLRRRIEAEGAVSVADYMAAANAFYYATRDPLGAAGDFTTAPEISQMFGELIGIWCADLWRRAGRPDGIAYVELGPGRGTLAADALRAMRGAGLLPEVHFVETSPVLRAAQAERVPDARSHDDPAALPEGPLLIVANEFFDALPVAQFDAAGRELMVTIEGGRFAREGSVATETSPAGIALARLLARRIVAQGGALLVIDYGPARPGAGDTLQAVKGHAFADPWEAPGSRDLTAHVQFPALAAAIRGEGASVHGPRPQGDWLEVMGIALRAAALARSAPERTEEIEAARLRLTAPAQMGRLFKAMAATAPGWPDPAGF